VAGGLHRSLEETKLSPDELGASNSSGDQRRRVVTIWSTYGDYHVARVRALVEYGFEVIPFAHRDLDPMYPFFQAKPESLVVVNSGLHAEVNALTSPVSYTHLTLPTICSV